MMYFRRKESDPRRNVLCARIDKQQGSAKYENETKQTLNGHNSKVSRGRAETGYMVTIHFYSSQTQRKTVFPLYLQIVEVILLGSG